MRSAPTQQVPAAEPVRPVEPAGSTAPGEFTRIFVKDATPSAKPAARSFEERQEGVPSQPARPKGFSSPGVSDAASGEPGFTQIFKPLPGARGAGSPSQPGQPFVPSARPEAARSDAQFGRPSDPPNAAKGDQSITSLIESLSSPSAAASGPRAPEPAPYRPDPLASYQPATKPAPPSDFESAGVTRFIQRLADPPAAQPAPAPPPPIREANAGPGEYTRIISSLSSPAASAPPAPPPAPAEAPAPGISFARPAAPPLPQNPIHVAMPPAAAPAPPAFTAPPVPAPRLPAAPAPPTVAAPKGKLEAMVPMLLVVNTFLLVIILVVMIFLIKSR